ncbi:TadG family pilus assembly protein [Dyella tabacisoli]|uniref:DUF2134 domain-containing protein n=1 Tax=Dyella tabacisoli TaxID=2282381 RepID=A0A369ULV5_9GAMM|nr:pilus assembly protein TadG-related protein [Dyella tabacisoli]RDD81323.1 hypothetical protein DVJ77_13610 [Dyella tabacisoli]
MTATPLFAHPNGLRQRGGTAIAMMLMLIGLLGMLGLIEVGYLYWAKRDTQKVADLAALAGAQQLQLCVTAGNADNRAARGNAVTENSFSGTLTITCGTWDPIANAGITDAFSPVANGVAANAVKVIASRSVLPFFGATALPNVSTEAVASGLPPVAAFSVGTTLLSVNGAATLPQFLQSIGLNAGGTSLVGYQGLANVTITPAGLLKQLGVTVPANIGVGDLNILLAAQLQAHALIDVLNAIVTLAGQQALTSANISLINAITAQLGNIPLNVVLGSTTNSPGGLFAQIVAPDGAAQSALNAQVNALQLLNTAIGVATGQHAIQNTTNLNLGLLNINAVTSVIEPPSMGVGGVGTTAYTAQVRTFIHITTPNPASVPLLGGVINLYVNLPIAIDLVDAQAKLTGLCDTTDSTGQSQATIAVTSSILKACVGNITQANAFSTAAGCDQIPGANTPLKLLGLSAAGINLLSLNTSFATNPLPANGTGTLIAGQTAIIPGGGNPLAIGTTVNNLVTALTTALIANTGTQPPANPSTAATQTATDLWNGTNKSLSYPARAQQALDEVQTASQGLQGLLGNVTGSVLDLLGNTVQLNVPGLLGDVGSLLNSVGNTLSGVLNNLGCALGSQTACIGVISGAMSGGGAGANSNAFLGLLSFLTQALQGPLDQIGSLILTPVLQNTLGLDLGQTTVDLQSLQCHRVQLVY